MRPHLASSFQMLTLVKLVTPQILAYQRYVDHRYVSVLSKEKDPSLACYIFGTINIYLQRWGQKRQSRYKPFQLVLLTLLLSVTMQFLVHKQIIIDIDIYISIQRFCTRQSNITYWQLYQKSQSNFFTCQCDFNNQEATVLNQRDHKVNCCGRVKVGCIRETFDLHSAS